MTEKIDIPVFNSKGERNWIETSRGRILLMDETKERISHNLGKLSKEPAMIVGHDKNHYMDWFLQDIKKEQTNVEK